MTVESTFLQESDLIKEALLARLARIGSTPVKFRGQVTPKLIQKVRSSGELKGMETSIRSKTRDALANTVTKGMYEGLVHDVGKKVVSGALQQLGKPRQKWIEKALRWSRGQMVNVAKSSPEASLIPLIPSPLMTEAALGYGIAKGKLNKVLKIPQAKLNKDVLARAAKDISGKSGTPVTDQMRREGKLPIEQMLARKLKGRPARSLGFTS